MGKRSYRPEQIIGKLGETEPPAQDYPRVSPLFEPRGLSYADCDWQLLAFRFPCPGPPLGRKSLNFGKVPPPFECPPDSKSPKVA